jgi:hypothetical protein
VRSTEMQVLVFVTPPCILPGKTLPQRSLQGTLAYQPAPSYLPAGRQGQKHERAGNMNEEGVPTISREAAESVPAAYLQYYGKLQGKVFSTRIDISR